MAKKEKIQKYVPSALNTPMLNYKVYVMNRQEWLINFLAIFIVGGLVGLVFYGGLFKDEDGYATAATGISNLIVFGLVGAIAAKVVMPMRRNSKLNKRKIVVTKQFRSFLDALATSLSSGMNMTESLSNALNDLINQYTEHSYIVAEVKEMIAGINNNIQLEDMLADFARRSEIVDIDNFAKVFAICYRAGGNMKEIVRRTSSIITEKIEITEEIETAITSNKTQFNAMMIIPVLLVTMMRLMSSDFSKSFGTPVGVVAMTVAIGIFYGAYRFGQKIMDVK